MEFHLAINTPASSRKTDDHGFVLVAAMVVLLALSMLGIWAMQTSNFELNIAGNMQGAEEQLNIADGATIREAVSLSHNNPSDPGNYKSYYNVSDPSDTNKVLSPATDATFDPGGDTLATVGGVDPANQDTWPMQNLFGTIADNEFDYRYLTTYLNSTKPPKGYDADKFSSYKFRVQGAAPAVIEMGINIVGPKDGM